MSLTLLEEIPRFPRDLQAALGNKYGIESAESFFDHAIHDPESLRAALGVPRSEVERLARLVEGYLAPEFVARSRRAPTKHPRGLIVDPGDDHR